MVSRPPSAPSEPEAACAELPRHQVKWCAVSISEAAKGDKRLDASFYNIDAGRAVADIEACPFPKVDLVDADHFVCKAHYGDRLKRNYIASTRRNAMGFVGSSEMLDTMPRPIKFMDSASGRADALRVKKGSVLISRSGTIGNLTYVNNTLSRFLVSEHAIRLDCAENVSGYVYAFLKCKVGQALVKSKIFGAVVQEIEPEHLTSIPVPNPPNAIKLRINDLIVRSYGLRDESNDMMDKATVLLAAELKLPPADEIPVARFGGGGGALCYTVKLSELSGRLDGSYHAPLARAIEGHLRDHARELLTVGDARVSKKIVLPGRFKRVYVGEGQGRVFIGGKQIGELDPSGKKYLSASGLSARAWSELEVSENAILITRSGTIGRVAIAPRHWEHWAASEHVIRVVPADSAVAGFLYIFLASRYGHLLIKRFTHGGVIDEIDTNHVSQIPFPMLKDQSVQTEINWLALEANSLRSEAYELERRAIKIMNDEVIYAPSGE
jgi:type I restriction enzyme S subunit